MEKLKPCPFCGNETQIRCALKDCAVYKDDFCSYGERKDGERKTE